MSHCAAVCIKAGELELALDVFQQLLREGCAPNLVTYNILIDVRRRSAVVSAIPVQSCRTGSCSQIPSVDITAFCRFPMMPSR